MTFGEALEELKKGKKVARSGWNGKGMYIFLMPTKWEFAIQEISETDYPIRGCICMKTAKDTIQLGWLASQEDMLSDDWEIVSDRG